MMRKSLLVVGLFLLSVGAWAQKHSSDTPAGEVFVGYSLLNGDTLSKASGWEASLMGNVHDWLGLKADFSGHYKSDGPFHAHQYNILFGPQVSDHIDKLNAFAHGLLGIAHSGSDFGPSSTGAGWVLGAGLDYDFHENFSVRIAQLDYHGAHTFGQTQGDFRFSAGLIYKFK